MSRPLVIYHQNCADGFGAAWCFWRKYGASADYLPGVYQRQPPDVTGRTVYLVDFSFKRDVVEQMLQVAERIILIDHHKSALEDLAGLEAPNFETFTSLERSGAGLAWRYLFGDEPVPVLLERIEDRDLWRFKLAGSREVHSFITSHDYSFELWDKLMAGGAVELAGVMSAGAAIDRKHRKDVEQLADWNRRDMTIGGHAVPVANMPGWMASDGGHLLCQGQPFAAVYWDSRDSRHFSLRSADDGGLDVSQIAALYGGGGHARAAGFKVPRDHELARA